MAASPRALHRITVWWRCNRDRSSVLPLPLTFVRARGRKKVRDGEGAIASTRARALPRQSFLKFIACGCGLVFSFRHDTNFFFFVVHERMRWNAFCQENVGADGRIRANYGVASHDSGSGVNADAVFDRRVAFFSTQGLSGPERARDERHA